MKSDFFPYQAQRQLLLSAKLAIGSSLSIIIAQYLGLDFASSAGIISMFTIMSTRKATLRLAGIRLISFMLTVFLAWLIFLHLGSTWTAFGVFVLLLSGLSLRAGWKNSLSANTVIGTHFWSRPDFRPAYIKNEFSLILIGIAIALFLDFFHADKYRQKKLEAHILEIDMRLQSILEQLAIYLKTSSESQIWEELKSLQQYLKYSLEKAYEHQENAFLSQKKYYILYINMRSRQCEILQSLHSHLQKLQSRPSQAEHIADFIQYIKGHVAERDQPHTQLKKLHGLLEHFRSSPLPADREEFESRAVLYHVLMDLEEFLLCKKQFLDSVNP